MTADPGSEAGAAGISAEERICAREYAARPDVLDRYDYRSLMEDHAAAATARAEKAEAEVARLRAALEDATHGLYCECHDLGPKGDPDCHACNALKALGVIPAERNTDPSKCLLATLGYWCAPRACPACDDQWSARGEFAGPARREGET
jgi:hypothetical protein